GHGACVNGPIPGCCSSDAQCSDGDLCTGVETCNTATGQCQDAPDVVCNDNDVCTLDSCDPMTGMCHFDPQPGCCNTNADCDDGNACPSDPSDDVLGCQHAPVDCDDGSPCTTDFCDQGMGCMRDPIPDCCVNDGECDDMNICTGFETCVNNTCQPGMMLDCDDHNPCTDDTCDAQLGCQHSFNHNSCDDGNACTTNDQCSGGSCVGGDAPDCDDHDICTTDSCDMTLGCQHANNTVACNDGVACTTDDHCT